MLRCRLKTITCCFLCICMMMLNVPTAGATQGKPRPPKKPLPKEKTVKPQEQDKTPKPEQKPQLQKNVNQAVIEYVKSMKQKNLMIPIFAQLAQRHISGVSDKNGLDIAFDNAVKKFPNIENRLPEFIDAYNAIPENLKKQKLIMPEAMKGGKATTAALSIESIKNTLVKTYPDKNGTLAQQAYNARKASKKNIPNPWENGSFGNTEAAPINYVEKPRITHLTPTGREPGETLTIYGMNFQQGKAHKVVLTFKDIQNAEPEYYEETAISSSQIDFDIPNDIIPGNYHVQVQAPGQLMPSMGQDSTPISDPGSYEIGIPKYKVYFNKMQCIDETRGPNNENIYQDSLVTFWGIGADERGWFKHSKKYQPFDDTSNQVYDNTDMHVLTPDDQWNKVQYGLVVSVDLYEWNWTDVEAGDSEEILDFAYCFFEEMYENNAWGDSIVGLLFDCIALLITPLIDMWVNLLTADPRFIENETIDLSAMDLQTMLNPGGSTIGHLNFKGQDGEYELSYTVKRQ